MAYNSAIKDDVDVTTIAGNIPQILVTQADGLGNNSNGLIITSLEYIFNDTTWDRYRGNVEGVILASAARTAAINSSDITNYNAKYLTLFVNITAVTSSPALTISVEWKDSISDTYEPIFTAAAATSSTGEFIYQLGPGLVAGTGGGYDDTEAIIIPRTFRVAVAVANSNSATYSISYGLSG